MPGFWSEQSNAAKSRRCEGLGELGFVVLQSRAGCEAPHAQRPAYPCPPARWCVAFLSPNSSAPGRPPHPVSSHAGAGHVKTCAKTPPPRCESPAGSEDANGRCQAPVQRAGRYSGKERSSSSPARLSSHALSLSLSSAPALRGLPASQRPSSACVARCTTHYSLAPLCRALLTIVPCYSPSTRPVAAAISKLFRPSVSGPSALSPSAQHNVAQLRGTVTCRRAVRIAALIQLSGHPKRRLAP